VLGFAEWGDERIDSDILALDEARIEIERALDLSAPEASTIPDNVPEVHLGESRNLSSGFWLYRHVLERVERICAQEYRYNLGSFVQLQDNQPTAAPYVLHQAIHEGLLSFDLELGSSLLLSEGPEVDNISIDAHIANAVETAAKARDALTQRQSARRLKALKQEAQDWQDRATALRQWRSIGQRSSYEKMIELCFDREYRDRSINRRLIDVLRELIFTTTVERMLWWGDDANKELALRMIPDEAIASAIVETCRCYGAQDTPIGDETVLRQKLRILKDATYFQVGDTLRTVIHKGIVWGAANGNPYMTDRARP
jgi:hypothetical protein